MFEYCCFPDGNVAEEIVDKEPNQEEEDDDDNKSEEKEENIVDNEKQEEEDAEVLIFFSLKSCEQSLQSTLHSCCSTVKFRIQYLLVRNAKRNAYFIFYPLHEYRNRKVIQDRLQIEFYSLIM